MDSKTRAILRSKATQISAIFQIGHEGITENTIKATSDALTARELIKISVLQTSPISPKDALNQLAQATNSIGVCTVGQKIVLYRVSNKKGIKHILEV